MRQRVRKHNNMAPMIQTQLSYKDHEQFIRVCKSRDISRYALLKDFTLQGLSKLRSKTHQQVAA
jgi:hypothetical protein